MTDCGAYSIKLTSCVQLKKQVGLKDTERCRCTVVC